MYRLNNFGWPSLALSPQFSIFLTMFSRSLLTSVVALLAGTVTAVPYEQYILAPSSRTLHPVSIHATNGTVNGAQSLTGGQAGSATFQPYSAVAYDFGI
jgi:hypothetical protein